jgi:hypothetical protein
MLSNKKGTHVGKILSFVIFIIFILYIYLIAQPNVETNKNKQCLLDYLKIELNEKLSSNLEIMTFSINSSSTSLNCLKLRKLMENYIEGGEKTIIVKNITKEILDSYISTSSKDLFVQRENNESIIKIYYSKDFFELPTQIIAPCEEIISGDDYTLESKTNYKKISEKKIISFFNDYLSDYEQIKIDLDIPKSIDFGVTFEYEDTTEISTPQKGNYENAYFEKYPIEYFTPTGEIKFGFLTIHVN